MTDETPAEQRLKNVEAFHAALVQAAAHIPDDASFAKTNALEGLIIYACNELKRCRTETLEDAP